jgi:hypothetical protein
VPLSKGSCGKKRRWIWIVVRCGMTGRAPQKMRSQELLKGFSYDDGKNVVATPYWPLEPKNLKQGDRTFSHFTYLRRK